MHRTNRGIVGDERGPTRCRRALDEPPNGLIPKVLVGVGFGDRREDAAAD